jgi:hypothetical protein
MKGVTLRALVSLTLLAAPPALAAASHHDIAVSLDLPSHALRATDRVTLAVPAGVDTLRPGFFLGTALAIDSIKLGGRALAAVDPDPRIARPDSGGIPTRFVRVGLPAGTRWPVTLEVAYHGTIHDVPAGPGQEYARSFEDSNGLIDSAGVFLSGASAWVPELPGSLFTFELRVVLPPGQRSMSQGTGSRPAPGGPEAWTCVSPQEEIYLIAGPYRVTEREHEGVLMQTFLYGDDPELAGRYLDATARYLDLYRELLGSYPYPKFALVENFWQTGFGMPSFTLLGDKVIRLPFIVSTSYGHEILHNWFGNGVYVEWEKGNWCEGLTSYLADHLYKEQDGQGAGYRRASLQTYREFVRHANDLPLTAFRSRHDPATEAVGYGKAMMTFHMLRLRLGDEEFVAGLRRLVEDFRFRRASWDDVRAAFEAASGEDLSGFFYQWVTRVGAPSLRLGEPRVTPMPDGFQLEVEVRQAAPAYALRVPLAVTVAGEATPRLDVVALDDTVVTYAVELAHEPLGVALDPAFDVWRRLERGEVPPSIGQALGAERTLIVLPSGAPAALAEGYRTLAATFSGAAPGTVEVRADSAVTPADLEGRAVWLLGWENSLRPRMAGGLARLARQPDPLGADTLRLGGRGLARAGRTVVAAAASEADPELAWVLVATDVPAAFPGLGRKLPHYRKYGYLVFEGEEPVNVAKGEWRVADSPLVVLLGGARYDAPGTAPDPAAVAPRKPLIEGQGAASR